MESQDLIDVAMSYPIGEIVTRYAADQEIDAATAEEHAREAKRFLILCALNPDRVYGMRGPIDEFWHTFVIFTSRYMDFCERVGGRFIHHYPNTAPKERQRYTFNKGRKGGPAKDLSRNDLKKMYLAMLDDYKKTFGEPAPKHLWPRPAIAESGGGVADDCACGPVCRCGCSCIA
ncbi:hypothetical protein GHK46_06355 [Sinorhizobium medicae]|uniref:glycine-rich domain-containing protein n=1 Tax=Sinorhizobium medicae TaxID=110321 RepID=UPI0012969787|nr:hypothetical protein [Sinorhizobium medicae]MQV97057.1 hypothetical protein [Sinorhizobium medicae]